MKGKIFNAQEVQAIIAGTKTQFREVIKPCKQHPKSLCRKERNCHYSIEFTEEGLFWRPVGGEPLQPFPFVNGKLSDSVSLDEYSPYQVGQKIFVKEDFCKRVDQETFEFLGSYHYRASCGFDVYEMDGDGWTMLNKDGSERLAWKPAQHMKQKHSRLTLQIKEIRVEHLQSISADDCAKEGIPHRRWQANGQVYGIDMPITQAFGKFWHATHKKPEEKFEANPWVFVYQFEIIK